MAPEQISADVMVIYARVTFLVPIFWFACFTLEKQAD